MTTRIVVAAKPKVRASAFVGSWRYVEFDNFDFEIDRSFAMSIEARGVNDIHGKFAFDLCQGYLDGALRVFGAEALIVFGFDAGWEMDELRGGGWLRLVGKDSLEGEFICDSELGKFKARRIVKLK